jgi:hypothetical protein
VGLDIAIEMGAFTGYEYQVARIISLALIFFLLFAYLSFKIVN